TRVPAPWTKNRPVPVITMHRTSWAATRGGSTARNSRIRAGFTALAGGLLIRTVATAPSRVTSSTDAVMRTPCSFGHASGMQCRELLGIQAQQFAQHLGGVLSEQGCRAGERTWGSGKPGNDALVPHWPGHGVTQLRIEASCRELVVAVHQVAPGRNDRGGNARRLQS